MVARLCQYSIDRATCTFLHVPHPLIGSARLNGAWGLIEALSGASMHLLITADWQRRLHFWGSLLCLVIDNHACSAHLAFCKRLQHTWNSLAGKLWSGWNQKFSDASSPGPTSLCCSCSTVITRSGTLKSASTTYQYATHIKQPKNQHTVSHSSTSGTQLRRSHPCWLSSADPVYLDALMEGACMLHMIAFPVVDT